MLIFIYSMFHRKWMISEVVSFDQISDYDSCAKQSHQSAKEIYSISALTPLTHLHPYNVWICDYDVSGIIDS